ncbi:MAG: putative sensor domain DACNV-containing protein [Gemmatimonadaceae bacterium]
MDPRFPAALPIAARIASHLARQMAAAHESGNYDLAVLPPVHEIAAVVDAAFWASLRHEEGFSPRISLAITASNTSDCPLLFSTPIEMTAAALAHLAPAVERPGIHLGVWPVAGKLHMWGTTRGIPAFCVVIEVLAPGVLVFKHRHVDDSVKYVNMAVLDGDDVKIVDESAATPSNCPQLISFLLGFKSQKGKKKSGGALVQLAVSMRAHRRGGLLLIVPDDATWKESVAHPVPYSIEPPYTALAEALRHNAEQDSGRAKDEAVRLAVDHVIGLTAVDGATVLTSNYDLLAFGAKIIRRVGFDQADRVLMTEPIEGRSPEYMNPALIGGTRHLSAVQFIHDQRNAVALVASQDGKFTVFQWSEMKNVVHGHRVEALLL